MTIWGINVIDLLIVIAFLVVLIWIGARTRKDSKSTQDFFLAGRKLNKMYQFFLNFGCSTHGISAMADIHQLRQVHLLTQCQLTVGAQARCFMHLLKVWQEYRTK